MTTPDGTSESRIRDRLPRIRDIRLPNAERGQVAVTVASALPDGFSLPPLDGMSCGNVVCDHSCDVEHEQTVDGRRFVTSVIWTTDAGFGTFPRDSIIGCQWIASIKEWHEPICHWDNGWDDVIEVMLDCDAGTPTDVAIPAAMAALADVVASMAFTES